MDKLDPFTEIVRSGQAFFPAIALERILWVFMGFFFLGAISTSIKNGMKQQDWFGNKSFLSNLKASKNKAKFSKKSSDED